MLRRARAAALHALLRRLDGSALDRLLRNDAGWVPAGCDDQGRSADGRRQHLLTPERVVCAGGGWDAARLEANGAWRAVNSGLTESGRVRRREVCILSRRARCSFKARNGLCLAAAPDDGGAWSSAVVSEDARACHAVVSTAASARAGVRCCGVRGCGVGATGDRERGVRLGAAGRASNPPGFLDGNSLSPGDRRATVPTEAMPLWPEDSASTRLLTLKGSVHDVRTAGKEVSQCVLAYSGRANG